MKCYIVVNTWNSDYGNILNELLNKTVDIDIMFEQITVLFLGRKCMKSSMELAEEISHAIYWESELYNQESSLYALNQLELSNSCVVFPSDGWGTEMAIRLATRAKGTAMTSVKQLTIENNVVIAKKRIASGNLLGEYRINQMPLCVSMAKSSGDNGVRKAKTVNVEIVPITQCKTQLKKNDVAIVKEVKKEKRDELLNAKRILVIGGGVKKEDDVEFLKEVASKIGAQIAGTKPVVMQGLLSMNRLIGVSGSIVCPELSIVVGASGMAGFYVGVENSNQIIAINRDEDALITKKSDQVLVADWKKIIWS